MYTRIVHRIVFPLMVLGLWAPLVPAQECRWCDRLASHVKIYKYKYVQGTKAEAEQVEDVETVTYVSFKDVPTRRAATPETITDDQVSGLLGAADTHYYYFVCPYHQQVEEALAFAMGGNHWKKYARGDVKGVYFLADELSDTTSDTVLLYSVQADPSEATTYVIEIDHAGYGTNHVLDIAGAEARELKVDRIPEGVPADVKSEFEKGQSDAFAARSVQLSAGLRVLALGPGKEDQPREVSTAAIPKLEEDIEITTDGGQLVLRIKFARRERPSDNADDSGATTDVGAKRNAAHWFGSGSRWVVRLAPDPLALVLPRSEHASKVKGDLANVRNALGDGLKAYTNELLQEYRAMDGESKELVAKDRGTWTDADRTRWSALRGELARKASDIEFARLHSEALDQIVYCQVHPSIPAVRIWDEATDPDHPRQRAVSPFEGAFLAEDSSEVTGAYVSYLTLLGAIAISSVLSFLGVKSAGG